jgi:hypothetical protein
VGLASFTPILAKDDRESRLTGSTDEAWATVKPYTDAQSVGPRVNTLVNNHANLIEPASATRTEDSHTTRGNK